MVALLLLHGAVASSAAATSPAPRPNSVMILTDDLGFSDLGCYGSEIAPPNLDRLTAEGKRLSQFYNPPRCGPTQAALLTGRSAPHNPNDTAPPVGAAG